MSSLVETINSALRSVGPAAEDRLRTIIGEFEALALSPEERLAAATTAVAAAAATHHRRHQRVYLAAVRTWSLEISGDLDPAPAKFSNEADPARIADGAEILVSGIEGLIELMAGEGVATQDRLITELAVVARLLGEHDARMIHLAMGAITRAVADEGYMPGMLVAVPHAELLRPVSRNCDLAALEPRGHA